MTLITSAALLQQLDAQNADVSELLRRFESAAHADLWRRDVRLYIAFTQRLLGEGHPARAFELAREGLTVHPANHALQYWRALALARGGNTRKATEYAQALLQESALNRVLESETLSLLGRLAKDRYERTPSSQKTRRRKGAEESAASYIRASQIVESSFPLINAATMSLLSGQKERAHQLATQAIELAQSELAQSESKGRGDKNEAWLLATLGEAFLVLGELSTSAQWYRKAAQAAAHRRGDLSSMRRNIALLQEKIEGAEIVRAIFNPGRVVVFAGDTHFFSTPADEEAARAALKERLDLLDANIGYCWPTPGVNILFAEVLLERGGELHLVVPAEREDFGFTDADLAPPELTTWRERRDQLLARATQVHVATRENFLSDRVLFNFAARVTQGLAVTRARELDAPVCVVAALQSAAPMQASRARPSSTRLPRSGAREFVAHWSAFVRAQSNTKNTRLEAAQTIALAGKFSMASIKTAPVSARAEDLDAPQSEAKIARGEKRARHVKAMLFADVKNFSHLSEEQTPAFFVTFLNKVAHEIAASKHQPAFANTWGDGLFLVFNSVGECADFALRLLERIEKTDWTRVGLPSDTTIRMGIHAGPVYASRDKIIGRTNFFGAHVNRAARIEPVTTPGCAFTTDQFASLLAIEAGEDFRCEYVGVEDLAKGYDRCVLYRLSRF